MYWRVPATVWANAAFSASPNVAHFLPISSKMSSIFFISPLESLILIPTLYKASEYFPNVVPSSRVLPNSKSWIRANNVLNAVPTTSALCLVFAVTVVKAAVAYS